MISTELPKNIQEKIKAEQKYISTNIDLKSLGYRLIKNGKPKIWVNEEYNKTFIIKNHDKNKENHDVWIKTHKSNIKKSQEKYLKTHKEERKKSSHRYYEKNKEKILEYNREYYELRKEEHNKYMREYTKTHKVQLRERRQKYYQNHKEEIKRKTSNYAKTKKGKEVSSKCIHRRKRDLGFVPLNERFENSEAHHINENEIIYIPKELHQSIRHNLKTGKNMFEINMNAFEFLKQQKGIKI